MKTPNAFIVFLTLLFCISCSASSESEPRVSCQLNPPSPYSAPARDDLKRLAIDMYGYSLGNDALGRPDWLQPQNILPRVHPWFQNGKTFCTEYYDDITYVKIAKIPFDVVNDLARISSTTSGIGLLNAKFWADVRKIQDQKIIIGFIENPGKHEFAGFYVNEYKFIAFDILANPGTPRHELRHHQQYESVRNTKYFADTYVLGSQCLTQVSRFFGELDANTFQLIDWVGAFNFHADTIETARPTKPLFFPQAELFLGYLNYPFLASNWLKNKGCPSSLLNAIDEITAQTEDFHRSVGQKVSTLARRSTRHYQNIKAYNSKCVTMHPEDAFRCEELKNQMQNFNTLVAQTLPQIHEELKAESLLRPKYIKAAFDKLDPETQKLLSDYSGGFKLLFELKGYRK